MSLTVDVRKKWNGFSLNVQLQAEDDTIGILGRSGSGKSMTLRAIAGIVTPDSGRIVLNGRTLFDAQQGINLPPRKRKVGLLFQNYALFDGMTVAQNIQCGIIDKEEKREKTAFYIDLLHLNGLEHRYPRQLSGGQQQRVALARMMASEPELLMLDEPFSAIDRQLRQQLEPEFTAALQAFQGTVLYVSHDIHEIFRYCNQTAILHQGKIVERAETRALFSRPKTVTGAQLLGCTNFALAGESVLQWRTDSPADASNCFGIFPEDVQLFSRPVDGGIATEIGEVQEYPRRTLFLLNLKAGGSLYASCDSAQAAKLLGNSAGEYWVLLPEEKLLRLQGEAT